MFLHSRDSKDDKINNVQDIATKVEENHLDQCMNVLFPIIDLN